MNTQVTLTVHFIAKCKKAESLGNIRKQDPDVSSTITTETVNNDLFLIILSILPH